MISKVSLREMHGLTQFKQIKTRSLKNSNKKQNQIKASLKTMMVLKRRNRMKARIICQIRAAPSTQ